MLWAYFSVGRELTRFVCLFACLLVCLLACLLTCNTQSLDEAEATHDAAEDSSEDALKRIKYLQAFVNVKYGALLVDADKAEESREFYDRAVELDSENMDVYVHRSQLWHSLKEPEKSQADLEMAVAKDPTVASSYVRLAASCLMVRHCFCCLQPSLC